MSPIPTAMTCKRKASGRSKASSDLSDILLPIKSAFAPNTLETTYLYNDVAKKKAYYGFPLKQQSMHVQIWGDMLEQAGFKASDIPTKWEDYWSFWCDKVQPAS